MAKKANVGYAIEFIQPSDEQITRWSVLSSPASRLPTLLGNCPTCNHECEVDISDVVVQGGVPAGTREPGPTALTRQIICNCGSDHEQPTGVRGGCGRYWLAECRREVDGSYRVGVQKNLRLLTAATALNDALLTQDKRIKDTAEKWIGAVTVAYSLFSLAGLATAENILSGLSAISKTLVGSALLGAFASAGLALFTGYLAAYGWPVLVPMKDDTDLAEWHSRSRHYSIVAAKRLREAIFLSFTSFGALAVMMSLVWFLPRQHG